MKELFLVVLLVGVVLYFSGIHKIDEGHVGLYWRGGALLTKVTQPGFAFKIPLLDSVEQIQVTVQTDKVLNIPCGTSGGVMLTIEKVEVVNRLNPALVYETVKNYTIHYDRLWIFDKIHHEINQFCSKHTLQEIYIDLFHTVDERLIQSLQEGCVEWAPGIEIIAIRITKPKIPNEILKNFEAMEAEKTKLLIANQTQKVVEKEAETAKKRAIIESEKTAAVAKIALQQKLQEKASQQKMALIEDETYLNREKALTDGHKYKLQKQTQANHLRLTDQFLALKRIEALRVIPKVFVGLSLSEFFQQDFLLNRTLPSNQQ